MSEFANWFRETTPYISAHRGKTFVVSLCGAALAHRNLINIVHDLALLHVLGVRLVIVFGARPQLDATLPERPRPGVLRITSESDLPLITAELAKLRAQLEARFSAGLPGSPLHNTQITLVGGNFVIARPVGIRQGIDHLFTGQVRSLKVSELRQQLDAGAIAVLPPSGHSPSGQLYNLSAEELAAETAIALDADKLITFAPSAYITTATGAALPELNPGELDSLLAELAPNHPDRPRLDAMLRACRRGVPRCTQVSFSHDGALLAELFTADGQGSQLSEAPFRHVRPAQANDISAIVALIRPLEQEGLLVRRSRVALEREIDRFFVAEVDDSVVGCCALHAFGDALELACVAVNPSQRNSRAPVGDQLLAAAEQQARNQQAQSLFVLTTGAKDWFVERGFTEATLDDLPTERRSGYDHDRASLILMKSIAQTPTAGVPDDR